MYKKDLSQAFSGLHAPDALVRQVLAPEKPQKRPVRVWQIARRVAVCAAVLALLLSALLWPTEITMEDGRIIAQPGILKVYACDLGEVDAADFAEYELTDTIESYKYVMVPHASANNLGAGIPFLFKIADNYYGDADISFVLSADYGYLVADGADNGFQQQVTIGNGNAVEWWNGCMSEAEEKIGSGGRFYVNVIIYADERIVGYGIIDFIYYAEEGMLPSFGTTGFTTVCFPLVDGEYQNVGEDYVWQRIEEYKLTKPDPEEEK